jgi:ATP-dependent 26S proteasome regulatory subunit
MIIKNLKELNERGTLQYDDVVMFNCIKHDCKVSYKVRERHLNNPDGANDFILAYLRNEGLMTDKYLLASEEYGYYVDSGNWPNFRDNDFEAATRLVSKIYKLIDPTMPVKKELKISLESLSRVVLEEPVKEEIIAVLKQHEHSNKIFKDWGLDETLEYGKGMGFLFYGKPGVGKTFTAHCIAKALGKELLVVSPAEIQSSEPGGANRAIQEAFKNAKRNNKILLLDECDGLITTRSDMGMIIAGEINTLLTEIEKFDGIIILSTNRIDTLDEALERRISLIIEFPEPNFDKRVELWKVLVPSKMPLSKDVVFDKLAEYKMTGGQIKNAILNAARFAAAKEQEKVTLENFTVAIDRINKSKSLMGKKSRFNQVDHSKGRGRDVKRDISI